MNNEFKIGATAEGDTVWLSIELRSKPGAGFNTVYHVPAPDSYLELAISGTVYEKGYSPSRPGRNERGVIAGGQVRDDLRNVLPNATWSADDLATLADLWDEWHLNGMQAGCDHMTLPADPSYDARMNITCIPTGYKYGHAWLVRELPADVIATVRRFQAKLAA